MEERCAAYQQDLYVLRGELITVQADADQEEELRAKFNQEVLHILYSDFIIDGHSAIGKPKLHTPDSTRAGEEVILAAIRQLANVWRGLVDQKCALERTVTKLSASGYQHPQSPVSSTTGEGDLLGEAGNEFSDSCNVPDFFPPRLDSFGLETILEEERNEEDKDSRHESDDVQRSKTSSVEVPHKPEVSCALTQTDEVKEIDVEALRAEILSTLEAAYLAKERSLNEMVGCFTNIFNERKNILILNICHVGRAARSQDSPIDSRIAEAKGSSRGHGGPAYE